MVWTRLPFSAPELNLYGSKDCTSSLCIFGLKGTSSFFFSSSFLIKGQGFLLYTISTFETCSSVACTHGLSSVTVRDPCYRDRDGISIPLQRTKRNSIAMVEDIVTSQSLSVLALSVPVSMQGLSKWGIWPPRLSPRSWSVFVGNKAMSLPKTLMWGGSSDVRGANR